MSGAVQGTDLGRRALFVASAGNRPATKVIEGHVQELTPDGSMVKVNGKLWLPNCGGVVKCWLPDLEPEGGPGRSDAFSKG